MNRRCILFVAASLALPYPAEAQHKALKDQLVGAWTYVSSTSMGADGTPLWGSEPRGLLIYTPDGRFSWHLFRSDRSKFASNNRLQGTPDENRAAVLGGLAYFGRYSVNEDAKSVTYHIEGSSYPNSEGGTQTVIITEITGEQLKYTNPQTTAGARTEAVWKRVR